MKIRDSVMNFAEVMEEKLQKNSHKGSWENHSYEILLKRLKEEVQELEESLNGSGELFVRAAIKECADVGNFAMMIMDNLRREIECYG